MYVRVVFQLGGGGVGGGCWYQSTIYKRGVYIRKVSVLEIHWENFTYWRHVILTIRCIDKVTCHIEDIEY